MIGILELEQSSFFNCFIDQLKSLFWKIIFIFFQAIPK